MVFRYLFLEIVAAIVYGQTVSAKDGNVFYKSENGRAIQITSSGLDADPCLSQDAMLIVFARRTPSTKIDTGLGELTTTNFGSRPPPARNHFAGSWLDIRAVTKKTIIWFS